jgi:hypothetical protein
MCGQQGRYLQPTLRAEGRREHGGLPHGAAPTDRFWTLGLPVEERKPRVRVCAYLHTISLLTSKRNQLEARDLLTQL